MEKEFISNIVRRWLFGMSDFGEPNREDANKDFKNLCSSVPGLLGKCERKLSPLSKEDLIKERDAFLFGYPNRFIIKELVDLIYNQYKNNQ